MKTERESFEVVDWNTEQHVGWGVRLTADDGNGELERFLQLTSNEQNGVNVLVAKAEYGRFDKTLCDEWQGISINDNEAIDVRNWFVKEYPFTKQELVDMMTEIAKGAK